MAVDGQVAIVLELKLLLLLARYRDLLIKAILLASGKLLGLQAFLVAPTTRGLVTFILSRCLILCLLKLAAVYMLRCIRCSINLKFSGVKIIQY